VVQDNARLCKDPVFGVIFCELFDNDGRSITLTLIDSLIASPIPRFHVILFFLEYWDYFNVPVADAEKFVTLIKVVFPSLHFFFEAGIDKRLLLEIVYRINDCNNWEMLLDWHFGY
jgi:hypothetical protein